MFIPKRLVLDRDSDREHRDHLGEELLTDAGERGITTPASGVAVDWNKLFSKSSKYE